MTSGVTSASSGSLVDPEPRSATQSPTLWESNHLPSSTLECGNTDLGLHNGYQILKISRLRPSRRIHNTCICICIFLEGFIILPTFHSSLIIFNFHEDDVDLRPVE